MGAPPVNRPTGFTYLRQVLMTGFLAQRVCQQVIGLEPELSRQKPQHLLWDDLAGGKKPSRVAQSTQL